jgi:hypothetical protein
MFTIEFSQPFTDVPLDVRTQLRARLSEIGRSLASGTEDSNVSPSIAEGGMFLELGLWRFHYRVDLKQRRILVEGAVFRRK